MMTEMQFCECVCVCAGLGTKCPHKDSNTRTFWPCGNIFSVCFENLKIQKVSYEGYV